MNLKASDSNPKARSTVTYFLVLSYLLLKIRKVIKSPKVWSIVLPKFPDDFTSAMDRKII